MGLGPLDDDFELVEARDRAAELRQMIRHGVDPLAEKRAERAKTAPTVATFREVAEDCIAALVCLVFFMSRSSPPGFEGPEHVHSTWMKNRKYVTYAEACA